MGDTARRIRTDVHALASACRDPRVPRTAKWAAALVVAYALSPIDLIPDFIPVLGYADDLVIVPLGIALVIRLIPAELMAEHRAKTAGQMAASPGKSWLGAVLVVSIWLLALAWIGPSLWRWLATTGE